MARDSFILYTEQKEIFENLTDEQAGQLIKQVFNYSISGEEPHLNSLLKIAFIPIRQSIDRNTEKWEDVKKKRSEAGKNGAEIKKQKQAKQANANFAKNETANQAVNVNDNVNVNDIKKENIKTKYGENGNVKFTDEEYEKVKAYFPNDYTERIQALDDYIQSKGKQYKDFFATLKTWARKEGYKPPNQIQISKKDEEFIEIDTSQLTDEEYDLLVKKKITIEELIQKGKIHV